MSYGQPTHGYDSYTLNDSYQPNSLWGSQSKALPKHRVYFAMNDGKSSFGSFHMMLGAYIASTKIYLERRWRSWTRASRSHSISPSKPLTTAPPSSSTAVFLMLCALWYSTSALSSNTGKAILTQFRYPITLTFVQFGFVAFYCLLFMSPVIRFSTLRIPNKAIIQTTLPMGVFQVVGHMFSSIAISRIPVSTVHTIKALSPLFTVAAYALLFGVSYSTKTYISLLPLTVGVMLACSSAMTASNAIGLLSAFGSALVFVSSNIFFKKVMPSNTSSSGTSHKLDKLNMLLYASSMAFVLMIPLWLYYDLPAFMSSVNDPTHITHPKTGHETPHSVTFYFFMNGTVNFAQNIIAFVILSSCSPVTYSIASLIKRVAVICIAIVWFKQTVHPIQAFGIFLTFTGLYMYNNAKSDVEKGEKKMRRVEAARDLRLPTTNSESGLMAESDQPPDFSVVESTGTGLHSAYPRSASSTTTQTLYHPNAIGSQEPAPRQPLSNAKIPPPRSINIPTGGIDSYPSPPVSPPSRNHPILDDYMRSEYHQPGPQAIIVS